MKFIRFLLALLVTCSLLFTIGCSTKLGFSNFKDRSKYVYPNSNVEVIGRATGTATGDPEDAGRLVKEAIQKAVDSKGGDMLINFTEQQTITITTIPIIPVPIVTYEVTVDGTVAKTEVGLKELK
jgi:hypothetical protein